MDIPVTPLLKVFVALRNCSIRPFIRRQGTIGMPARKHCTSRRLINLLDSRTSTGKVTMVRSWNLDYVCTSARIRIVNLILPARAGLMKPRKNQRTYMTVLASTKLKVDSLKQSQVSLPRCLVSVSWDQITPNSSLIIQSLRTSLSTGMSLPPLSLHSRSADIFLCNIFCAPMKPKTLVSSNGCAHYLTVIIR